MHIMEKTTSNTFLYYADKADGTYAKLMDITSYPDIFSAPERLDRSDLSSNQKKYVEGMIDLPNYEFGFNYDKASFDAAKAKEGKVGYYQIRFGANGEYGAWQWSGTHFTTPTGEGVGATRKGKIVCYPESAVTEATISGS